MNATMAAARLTSDSSASESRPTEPVMSVGAALERDRGERGHDRDDGVAAERGAIFHARRPPAAACGSTSAMVSGALPSARLLTSR